MTENRFTSARLIDGKPRKVIVDETGEIINRNPSKEDLKDLEDEPYKKQSYTKEQLLGLMIQFREENGRSPTKTDFVNNPKYPSCATYQRYFGSWNNALKISRLEINHGGLKYTDNDYILGYLVLFFEENGRTPTENDFRNNHKYPSYVTYIRHFGSWNKALKLVGLDIDSVIIKGIIENNNHKGRLFETYVMEYFSGKSIDISGDNYGSPFDGICPKGQIYDAKSSKLYVEKYWIFRLNKGGGVDFYILGAFDKDYKKLLHVWIIPGDFIDGPMLRIGLHNYHRDGHNIENMKEYEYTEKFKDPIPV